MTVMGARASLLAGCALLLAVLLPAVAGCSSGSSQSDYDTAYSIGLQAYTYGLPLLETNKTFLTMTSVNVSNGNGFGPVNQFNHVRKLNDPSSTAVVAPGANALSSIAWLDLTTEPQVLHVPAVTDHDFVLALLDPYTEDLRNLGSAHDTPAGDYVICGPGQHDAQLPAGTQRIDVDYTRIWVIGSTQLKGQDDVANVNKIQDGYTLTPLSKYGTDYQPPAPAQPDTTVDNYSVPTGVEFFDTLGQLLQQFPPPAADKDQLAAFATVGIGPGKTPSKDSTSERRHHPRSQGCGGRGPGPDPGRHQDRLRGERQEAQRLLPGRLRRLRHRLPAARGGGRDGIGCVHVRPGHLRHVSHRREREDVGRLLQLHHPHAHGSLRRGEGWTLTVYDTKGALIQNSHRPLPVQPTRRR